MNCSVAPTNNDLYKISYTMRQESTRKVQNMKTPVMVGVGASSLLTTPWPNEHNRAYGSIYQSIKRCGAYDKSISVNNSSRVHARSSFNLV